MGRRALRKLDAAIDLSGHLKEFADLHRPWDPIAVFGRCAPLEVEVGTGKGLFLAASAAHRPEADFLGIEIARKYAQHAAARLARAQLANALVVRADARSVFREILPASSLARVHVYFPDPWWKARHKKRRVMSADFLRHIERTLAPEGTLHFWSDVQEYFETTCALVAASTGLLGPLEESENAPQHDLDYRTHFERRMRLAGQRVFRAFFLKPTLARAAQTPEAG